LSLTDDFSRPTEALTGFCFGLAFLTGVAFFAVAFLGVAFFGGMA
jgi:hypothetical protein